MTGHCAPACHCACSPATTFVPVMFNPALFSTITSSSSARSTRRPSPSSAAPLLVPKPKPKPVDAAEDDDSDRGCPGLLCGIGIAGLVVAAVILVILLV